MVHLFHWGVLAITSCCNTSNNFDLWWLSHFFCCQMGLSPSLSLSILYESWHVWLIYFCLFVWFLGQWLHVFNMRKCYIHTLHTKCYNMCQYKSIFLFIYFSYILDVVFSLLLFIHILLFLLVFFTGEEPINERKRSMRLGYSYPMHWSSLMPRGCKGFRERERNVNHTVRLAPLNSV